MRMKVNMDEGSIQWGINDNWYDVQYTGDSGVKGKQVFPCVTLHDQGDQLRIEGAGGSTTVAAGDLASLDGLDVTNELARTLGFSQAAVNQVSVRACVGLRGWRILAFVASMLHKLVSTCLWQVAQIVTHVNTSIMHGCALHRCLLSTVGTFRQQCRV